MGNETALTVTPSNITGAAVFAQFSIVVIMSVGAAIIHKGEHKKPSYYGKPRFSSLAWTILLFALITIGCLLLSDEFAKLWLPLIHNASTPTMPWRVAIFVMFVLDIFCVTILVRLTGGSRNSAFSPLYFLLPTLSILLREPPLRLLIYVSLTIFFFTILLFWFIPVAEEKPKYTVAYWLVSMACFLLATAVGYIARSQ